MFNNLDLNLKPFSLSDMVINPIIAMVAKRGSGKSYLTRDIMYHCRDIPCGVVISTTECANPFFRHFFPDLFIHYEIDNGIFAKIMNRQKKMKMKQKNKKKVGKKVDPSCLIVMDDCVSDKKIWAKDINIRRIFMNGRHFLLTYIVTMQDPLGIPPDLRLNCDYIFLLKEDSVINKKKLYSNYASNIPTYQLFEKVFAKSTRDHRALVIDNRKPTDKISDKIFTYKARERKFSFGSKRFKQYHNKHYNPKHDQEDFLSEGDDNPFLRDKKKCNDIKVKILDQ